MTKEGIENKQIQNKIVRVRMTMQMQTTALWHNNSKLYVLKALTENVTTCEGEVCALN